MSVKKMGKAIKILPDRFVLLALWWGIAGGKDFFCYDRRLLEERVEIKALKKKEPRHGNYRDPQYKKERSEYYENLREVMGGIYEATNMESLTKPIRLRLRKKDLGFLGGERVYEYGVELYCLYKDCIYKFDRPGYSDDEIVFQIMELEDKERVKFERLKHRFSVSKQEEIEIKRERIPEEVRIAVWRREGGKCARCGSREKLEYDHIVPVSKGGSNTIRNIELLCEKCNREKNNNIQ